MSETISLIVTGMKCGGCEANITGKLQALAGIESVRALHKENRVELVYDAGQVSLDEVIEIIEDAGFSVED